MDAVIVPCPGVLVGTEFLIKPSTAEPPPGLIFTVFQRVWRGLLARLDGPRCFKCSLSFRFVTLSLSEAPAKLDVRRTKDLVFGDALRSPAGADLPSLVPSSEASRRLASLDGGCSSLILMRFSSPSPTLSFGSVTTSILGTRDLGAGRFRRIAW